MKIEIGENLSNLIKDMTSLFLSVFFILGFMLMVFAKLFPDDRIVQAALNLLGI